MFIYTIIMITITTMLIFINSYIAKKIMHDREKPSPFECGFDPKTSARLPFSLRFYLIAVIFLVFDVEVTLILPFPLSISSTPSLTPALVMSFFIIILILGTLHEWNQGALNWAR